MTVESILLIEDDVELCSMLDDYLTPHGIQLTVRHHADSAKEEMKRGKFDLIVLDVMLPGVDGFTLLRWIRDWSDIAVLLLTARGEESDRITGFESGADDYLAKPFNPKELLARIRAILRRGKLHAESTVEGGKTGRRHAVDELVMDSGSRTVYCRNQRLELTAVEFELLAAFLEAPGKVLDREELVKRIFQRPFHPEDRSLDMCVSRLRRKLDAHASLQSRIKTIRSAGYLFSTNDMGNDDSS
jgi:two-component system response regulator CpxR